MTKKKKLNKILSLIGIVSLCMAIGTVGVFASQAERKNMTQGVSRKLMCDTNKSGNVDLIDVTNVLKYALSIVSEFPDPDTYADVNYDGTIDLDDVTLALKYALTILPVPTVTEDPNATVTPKPKPMPIWEIWGLGKNQTKQVSLNRDYDWYIDQSYTGYASNNNCGPSCTVMAARWSYKDFPKSVEDARDTAPNNGGWWYFINIVSFLEDNDIPCQVNEFISESDAMSHLDNGNILIICLNTGGITTNFKSEERTGKYYGVDTGHFIVLKGYMIVDGKTYFEVYDPFHSNARYADGTEKGRDRYYLASEVIEASLSLWYEYIVVSEK